MPNVHVAAAASGLPKSDTVTPVLDDTFHLLVGRELAGIVTERDVMERQTHAPDSDCLIRANYLRGAIEHLDDREEALLAVLAAFPSTTLAGAAIQLFAAVRLFDRLTLFTEPDPAEERAMRRLLWAAGDVIADAAGLDREADGPNAIAGTTGDPWRDVFAVLAEVKAHMRETVSA